MRNWSSAVAAWRLLRPVALLAGFALVTAACTTTAAEDHEAESSQPAIGTDSVSPPALPPDIDMAISIVALEDVHFDTFDGGSVTLADSTSELRTTLLDAIPPIDEPVYGDISTGDWLEPTDLVLGYVAGNQPYAFPFKIMNFHEIVNDVIAGVPVLVSYCPLCGSAIVYDRRVGTDTLEFRNTSALYESDMVMVDTATGSYWWQVPGSAIVGPLSGAELEMLPSSVATWADWSVTHPDTLVLTRDTGFPRSYERDSFASYSTFLDEGNFAFPVGEHARDQRLPPSALVVGVRDGETVRVFPVDGVTEPINDTIGGVPIVVLPTTDGAAVFLRSNGGTELVFENSDGVFSDTPTNTTWDSGGKALTGPLQGTQLEPVPNRTTFWFAMIGAFPDAVIWEPPAR